MKTLLITSIYPNPKQPRQYFKQAKLEELAQSIKENGLLSPIVVVKSKNGYMIIAGERRYRACKIAKRKKIAVRIIKATKKQISELALIENLQREDLNVIEEAKGYKQIIDNGTTPEELAKKLGFPCKGPITQKLKLIELDEFYQGLLLKGIINYHHALNLAALPSNMRMKFLQKIKEGKIQTPQKGYTMVNTLMCKQDQESFIECASKKEISAYKKYDKMIHEIIKLIKKSYDHNTLSLLPMVINSTLTVNIERIDLIIKSLNKIKGALQHAESRREALS